MKVFTFVAIMLLITLIACNQDPRARFPELSYRMADSVTIANTNDIPKGRPVVLFHFEEDCIDCQETTDSLIMKMYEVKNIRFYFLTREDFHRLNKFRKHFHFDKYPNITIGQDYTRQLPKHYDSYRTPLIALFNSRRKLVEVYNGRPNNNELMTSLKSLK